jgi:hypothetical protein
MTPKHAIGETITIGDAANFYHGERATILHYSIFRGFGVVYTVKIIRPSGSSITCAIREDKIQ